MRTTVSVRWQTVIPQEVREALRIEPNSKLEWEVKEGFILVHPIPADPVRASLGFFRDLDSSKKPSLTRELLAERRRDRERDEEVERRFGIPPRQD
ncbi:MAG TPA: AbrB/MazE/SpoVT family DNA-binding domain-containing protein [Thermoanaerobaculia bacterium]|nr:AbrB/MazE/SpoVT family DNA-binding domain-containing protein [Thermoanaerobaculia bacterium]